MPEVLNSITDQYQSITAGWTSILFFWANRTFLMLATVEIGLSALLWMLQHEGIETIGMGLIKKFLWLGFLYAVLLNADTWLPAIIDSFTWVGRSTAGFYRLDPGSVIEQGDAVALSIFKPLSFLGLLTDPASLLVGVFAALVVDIAFALIAIQMALTLIESYIVLSAGVFLLGFAAFRGTAAITERFLGFVVAVGIKLFMMYLMIGAGKSLAVGWGAKLATFSADNPTVALDVISGSLLFFILVWLIPNFTASLANGAVNLSFAEVVGTTFMATRLAGTAAGAAATPRAAAQLGHAAGQLGKAVSQAQGGGWSGALTGVKAASGALSKEAMAAAVPRLHRATENVRSQIPKRP